MLLIKSKRLRDTIRVVVPFIAVPLITVLGALAFDEKEHIIIALAVAVSALLLFASSALSFSPASSACCLPSLLSGTSVCPRNIFSLCCSI